MKHIYIWPWRTLLLLAALVALAVFLVACAPSEREQAYNAVRAEDVGLRVSESVRVGYGRTLRTVDVDGGRCVLATGADGSSAISCWSFQQ